MRAQRRTKNNIQTNKLWIQRFGSWRGWSSGVPMGAVWFSGTVGGLCRNSSRWVPGKNAYWRMESFGAVELAWWLRALTGCSSRECGFKSQHSHDGSQPFLNPIPKPSSALEEYCIQVVHNIRAHKIETSGFLKNRTISLPLELNYWEQIGLKRKQRPWSSSALSLAIC